MTCLPFMPAPACPHSKASDPTDHCRPADPTPPAFTTELLNKDTDPILPPLEELTPAVPPSLVATAGASSSGARSGTKKRKKTETGAAAPAAPPSTDLAHSDSEEDSEDELLVGGYRPGRAGLHYAHDFNVPCNSHIIRVIELLRKEWKEVVEIVGAVKLWIQLSIPPIESGGESVHPPASATKTKVYLDRLTLTHPSPTYHLRQASSTWASRRR